MFFTPSLLWEQPEGDKCRLHGFFDDGEQVSAKLAQIDFAAQGRAEGGQRPGGVILAAIEAAINQRLETAAQRLEEGGNRQSGDDQHDGLLC